MSKLDLDTWTIKYAPQTLDDLILSDRQRKYFKTYLDNGTFIDCTLVGPQGIGKTSVAKIAAKTLGCSHILLNCSLDRGIGMVREKIAEFVQSAALPGTIKMVIMDETNNITEAAWDSMRTLIDQNQDDTRFVMTCNQLGSITPPVLSRCNPIHLEFTPEMVFKRVAQIMKSESVEFNADDLKQVYSLIVQRYFPDVRRIIKDVHRCCLSGKFEYQDFVDSKEIDELVDFILNDSDDVRKIREVWINQETVFQRDYIDLASRMFDRVDSSQKMEVIADFIHRMTPVLHKEIQFTAMIMQLKRIK